MEEEVFATAMLLGDATEAETPVLRLLCKAAQQELTGRLRPEITVQDCAEAFQVAAAWLALAGLLTGRESEGVSAWTAGPVSVKREGAAGDTARALREQAQQLMAPYLQDESFWFRGVSG